MHHLFQCRRLRLQNISILLAVQNENGLPSIQPPDVYARDKSAPTVYNSDERLAVPSIAEFINLRH